MILTEEATVTVTQTARHSAAAGTALKEAAGFMGPVGPASKWGEIAPRIVGHPLDFRPSVAAFLADEGNVCLWRFRAEWKRLSRIDGLSSLSRAEAARVARFPKSAYSKRFAVGRAVLREILSGMTGVSAGEVALTEDAGGRPALDGLSISVVHAGLWIVAGISRSAIGLAAFASPSNRPDFVNAGSLHDDRAHVRNACLVDAGVVTSVDMHLGLFDQAQPYALFDSSSDGRWFLVDVPMAGANLLSLAAASPVRDVHAFGWTSSDGRVLRC